MGMKNFVTVVENDDSSRFKNYLSQDTGGGLGPVVGGGSSSWGARWGSLKEQGLKAVVL